MTRILLTGSSGFVGRALAARLEAEGIPFVRAVRQGTGAPNEAAVGSIGSATDWTAALSGCTAVIHAAARTPRPHVSDAEYREVNDLGTARLAGQAKAAGVETFILLSSIFALAENASSAPLSDASTISSPLPYGRSKLAAERHVAEFAVEGRAGIALRPPMVYGAEAGGNWRLLQKIAATGAPLPFGAVRNRRTLISIDNLVDAVLRALDRADPSRNGAYAVADGESVSLPEIIRHLREGMGKPARLLPVPPGPMARVLKGAGRGQMADSLFGDMEVDASRFRRTFDWRPVEAAADGIRKSGRGFAAA